MQQDTVSKIVNATPRQIHTKLALNSPSAPSQPRQRNEETYHYYVPGNHIALHGVVSNVVQYVMPWSLPDVLFWHWI